MLFPAFEPPYTAFNMHYSGLITSRARYLQYAALLKDVDYDAWKKKLGSAFQVRISSGMRGLDLQIYMCL